jgi:alginate O-acetyltransferase complex protein AlgI
MILGAVVVWFGPQTWDYTRKLTPVKAVLILGLFGISLVILTTQSFNPFIYFIF